MNEMINNTPTFKHPTLRDCENSRTVAASCYLEDKETPFEDKSWKGVFEASLKDLPCNYVRTAYIVLNENIFAIFTSKRTKQFIVFPCDELGMVNDFGVKFNR